MNLTRTKRFKERFGKYYQMLCRIAYGYIPDADECEDIVQETFITVWNKQKDRLSEKEFTAYMITAVKNNCISFLRKQTADRISIDDDLATHSVAHLQADTSDDAEKYSPHEKIQQLLSILPPKCKEVFMMNKLYGMKYREIASELEISEKTVENQMGKAIRMLREFAAKNPVLFLIIVMTIMFFNNKLR